MNIVKDIIIRSLSIIIPSKQGVKGSYPYINNFFPIFNGIFTPSKSYVAPSLLMTIKVKTVITNYDFRLKVKTIIDDYDFIMF